ncbi:hypothetical protein [Pedobacter sp. NJ-S-72]
MTLHTDFSLIYESIIATVLALWFLLTILCQFRDTKFSAYIRHTIDIFGLIPLWTFFAPNLIPEKAIIIYYTEIKSTKRLMVNGKKWT